MNTEQLLFIDEIDEKKIRKAVIKQLKRFKALRVAVQNKDEQLAEGVENPFPKIFDNEKEKRLKVKQMERALEYALDDIERTIIKRKYLSSNRDKDINIYMDLGINKDQFYEYKKQAIFSIAEALNIV
ncbi:ArpU family phage packaging/lysis transcriptional regulator [Bacillus sp. UNCCL81]|uniref:ArpU family phage packaging/lysis transcriptional regulator n=1 Tax=Bacillus sp. UNCCL81 TaxID=1502755 RepID=UPI0008E4365F|nr:ArpU family phage packaging/lysis transcriptional regulator [Bacillus sp. UNCCL81]SFD44442.1 phage transcriptional regulator, ArpU family [Bacillus sp. UNCCL81]